VVGAAPRTVALAPLPHIAGPFNPLGAVNTPDLGESGLFLGDHEALVWLRSGFGDIFAASRPLSKMGPSSIFFRALQFGR
jgi:hypothetical protein